MHFSWFGFELSKVVVLLGLAHSLIGTITTKKKICKLTVTINVYSKRLNEMEYFDYS